MPADADTLFKRRKPNFFEKLFGIGHVNENNNSGGLFGGRKRQPQWWENTNSNGDTSLYGGEPGTYTKKAKKAPVQQAAYVDPEVASGIGMGNLTYIPPVVVPVVDPSFSKLTVEGADNNAIRLVLSDRGTQIRSSGDIRKAVLDYYKASSFKPLWTSNGAVTERAIGLLGYLAKADEDGLAANTYLPKPLTDFFAPQSQIDGDSLAAAELDVGLTVAAVTYAQHLSGGAYEPNRLSGYNDLKPEKADAVATLNAISWISQPEKYLAGLAPKHPAYALFKAELARLQTTDDAQDQFPSGPRVKVGKSDPRIPQLRDIMLSMNYLGEMDAIVDSEKEEVLDKKLSKALKSFQESKRIAQTGVLDDATVKALSGPDKNQMRETLITNMERVRWLPKDLGRRHVFVNQAAFRVDVMDDGKPVWSSKVVVGKPMTQTAVFSDAMETVVFNPSWGIPQSILLNEYLPKLRRDPGYLDRIGFKVVNSSGKLVSSSSVNWYGVGSNSQIGVQQPPGAVQDEPDDLPQLGLVTALATIITTSHGTVLGWIGGIETYDGNVWELHPLVVSARAQGRGIGRKLVEDLEAQVAARGGMTLWVGSDDEDGMTSLAGADLYPNPLEHLAQIKNLRGHPYEFYQKLGFAISGVMPDANGFGKPDIFLAKRVTPKSEPVAFKLKVNDEIEIRMLEESDAETVFAAVDRNREHLREWLIWVDRTDSPEVTRQYIHDSKLRYENKEMMSGGIWLMKIHRHETGAVFNRLRQPAKHGQHADAEGSHAGVSRDIALTWLGIQFAKSARAAFDLSPLEGSALAKEETIVSGMAGRYASALHALAAESGATAAVGAALSSFQKLIDESPDLQRLVKSPVFSAEDQTRALSVILDKAGISGVAANFIKLVAAKRRLFAISDMIAGYAKLEDAANGVTRAVVTAAAPLTDAQTKALRDQLAAVAGAKSVDVDVKIDPAIIGGLVVKVGSRMVDSSLKTKLNAIRTRMKEVG